jgi:AcrR family transcriptional regulator
MIDTIKIAPPTVGLRLRKKLEMMRHVQWTALDLFEAHGFDAVTIDEIAAAAVVSSPTIYRHFSTKDGIVLWDEYDPMLFDELARLLPSLPPVDAVREAIARPLDLIYAADATRILRRVRLVNGHAGLRAAGDRNLRAMRCELARAFVEAGACHDAFEADVVAGATTSSLEIAIDYWARADGAAPLSGFIDQALRNLSRLAGDARRAAGTRAKR